MIYLLDTNAVSALMREEARVASWLSARGVDDRLVICTVTRGEILFGLERLARAAAEQNSKARPETYSMLYPVSRSHRQRAISTRKPKLLNSAVGRHSTRTIYGWPQRRSRWAQLL